MLLLRQPLVSVLVAITQQTQHPRQWIFSLNLKAPQQKAPSVDTLPSHSVGSALDHLDGEGASPATALQRATTLHLGPSKLKYSTWTTAHAFIVFSESKMY